MLLQTLAVFFFLNSGHGGLGFHCDSVVFFFLIFFIYLFI